jgi:hypothetical protein
MPNLSDDELDTLLLGEAGEWWSKVAAIIAGAMLRHNILDENRLGNRIVALVESGKLEAKGNVRNWRFSEVRLPTSV